MLANVLVAFHIQHLLLAVGVCMPVVLVARPAVPNALDGFRVVNIHVVFLPLATVTPRAVFVLGFITLSMLTSTLAFPGA